MSAKPTIDYYDKSIVIDSLIESLLVVTQESSINKTCIHRLRVIAEIIEREFKLFHYTKNPKKHKSNFIIDLQEFKFTNHRLCIQKYEEQSDYQDLEKLITLCNR